MIPVFLTASYRQDLETIWDFLAQHSPESADRVTLELIERALKIGEAPLAAAIVPQIRRVSVRRVLVRRWSILYHADQTRATVLRVVPGGRSLSALRLVEDE